MKRVTSSLPYAPPAPPPVGLPASGRRGFTLVEMIGVLTVIMILAAAVVPALLAQLDRALRAREERRMIELAEAFKRVAMLEHRVPGRSTVFADVANVLGWTTDQASTTENGNARVLMVDPSLRLGTGSGATLPYTQTAAGSIKPVRPRVMLISSVGSPLPSAITGTPSQTTFDRLWGAADGAVPSGWTSGGDFEDIIIQRINFDSLFTQLILNRTPTGSTPRHAIDDGATQVASSASFSAYYLLGTVVSLYDPQTNLQARTVLQDCRVLTNTTPFFRPPSFSYENGQWRGRMLTTAALQQRTGTDLQSAYAVFMAATANPIAKPSGSPVTQSHVTADMFSFMSNYVVWADSSWSSSRKSAVTTSRTAMETDTKNYHGK